MAKLDHYPARALRALGLLLADGVLTVGWGRLFGASDGPLHENGRNSETKSRTIDPKVPKIGVPHKKTDFRAKIRSFGAKKRALLTRNQWLLTMF